MCILADIHRAGSWLYSKVYCYVITAVFFPPQLCTSGDKAPLGGAGLSGAGGPHLCSCRAPSSLHSRLLAATQGQYSTVGGGCELVTTPGTNSCIGYNYSKGCSRNYPQAKWAAILFLSRSRVEDVCPEVRPVSVGCRRKICPGHGWGAGHPQDILKVQICPGGVSDKLCLGGVGAGAKCFVLRVGVPPRIISGMALMFSLSTHSQGVKIGLMKFI